MPDNNDNREARMSSAIGLGVWRIDGKPIKEYDPWELKADELLREAGRTGLKKDTAAYFAFLRTKPERLK